MYSGDFCTSMSGPAMGHVTHSESLLYSTKKDYFVGLLTVITGDLYVDAILGKVQSVYCGVTELFRKKLQQPQSDDVIEGDGREFRERAAMFTAMCNKATLKDTVGVTQYFNNTTFTSSSKNINEKELHTCTCVDQTQKEY